MQVSLIGYQLFLARQLLVVRQHLDSLGRKAAPDELVAHELARSKKEIDAALAAPASESFDVGLLWYELTGKDMVYAVWVARDEYVKTNKEDVARVSVALDMAIRWGEANMDQVIARAQAMRPRPTGFYESYYQTLNYRLDPPALVGLATFARVVEDVGLLPEAAARKAAAGIREAAL